MNESHRPLTLQVIVGSVRPTRNADLVLPWVSRRALEHDAFEVEVIDLRDWPLPGFCEHMGSIGDPSDPTYSDPLIRRWNDKLADGDCYLFVTPEYNHSIPGLLKNAIDNVFLSFALRNKPAVAVAYSAGIAAGARAVEQLALVAVEAEMVPLRNSVLIPFVRSAFDERALPVDPMAETALAIALDDLAWWGAVLARARERQLAPAATRRAPPIPSSDSSVPQTIN
jgi:NAD(P)H-dependent FMN reductase